MNTEEINKYFGNPTHEISSCSELVHFHIYGEGDTDEKAEIDFNSDFHRKVMDIELNPDAIFWRLYPYISNNKDFGTSKEIWRKMTRFSIGYKE